VATFSFRLRAIKYETQVNAGSMGPFWKRARHQKAADCEEVEVGIAMTPSNVVNTPEVEIIDGLVAERPDNSDWKARGLHTKCACYHLF
jgi:hypothetical protein